ncbi:integrase [Halovenus marina]|uniref:integrase n=1 Tax=Halovenus marina TaxID=3396621 RepID=UPI003F543D7A
MSKKRVNISVDPDLHARAKELGLNVSGVAEHALQSYIRALDGGEQTDSALVASSDPPASDALPTTETTTRSHSTQSVEETLDEYTDYAITVLNRSEQTLDQHRRYLDRLLRHAEKPPDAIEEADIIAYLESEQPMSESKKQNILSAVRVFFREYVESEIADSFKLPTTSPNPTTVPTKADLQTFYDAIENPKYQTIFLMYATSGLRSSELVELTIDDINEDDRMLIPENDSAVKQTWVSFYNEEAEQAYEAFKPTRAPNDERLFQASKPTVNTTFQRLSEKSGVKITPQMLRRWFASEMASLGVDSSYIDAFCGRTPDSVLEKHYLDYSPRKLKQIYDDAGLTLLE